MSIEHQTITERFPWAVVGATAIIFEQGSWGYTNQIETKISRVSTARITLEGGKVFYVPKGRSELSELGRDYYLSGTLLPPDDPRITAAKETRRKEDIRLAAREAAKQYAGASDSEEKARAAITALQAFLDAWVEP